MGHKSKPEMYDLWSSKAVIYNYTNCFASLKAVGHGNTAAFGLANKPSFGTNVRVVSFQACYKQPTSSDTEP